MFLQYNSEANGQDLVSLANDKAKTNSTSFPIAQKTRAANEAMRKIWGWIFEAYGGWHYDDRNLTDLPEATTSVVSSQQQYTFPTDSAAIMGIEIKNSGGTWASLRPITLEQIHAMGIAESEFMKTAGTPAYYRLVANGYKLYPAANYSLSSALKVYLSRDVSTFVVGDTTKTPGFDTEFHEAVGCYMALYYARINDNNNLQALEREWSNKNPNYEPGWEQKIKTHYSMRFKEMFPARMRSRDALTEFS